MHEENTAEGNILIFKHVYSGADLFSLPKMFVMLELLS